MKQNATLRSDDRSFFLRPHRYTVRNAVKDRLIISGVALAALPLVIFSVPWTHTAVKAALDLRPWVHMTLEASLNLLWVLLTVGAFVHWAAPGSSRRRTQLAGLVSLVFVVSLLFPVISANDDLAQLDLINDAKTSQLITASLKSNKQLPGSTVLLGLPAAAASQVAPSLPLASEFIPEPAHSASVATPGDATGNHSPPLC
ncbi:MAG: hypothetical protein ACHP7I_04265 [Terriglobales bacterium]